MSDIHDRHPNEDLLQTFLDGDLPSRERRRVEEHVASCARCTEELEGWRLLFTDLDGLRSHRPSADFQARVMAGVQVPQEVPWAARMKERLAALVAGRGPEHVGAGVLQDLAEGLLPVRRAAKAERHLEGCVTCAAELRAWTTVMGRLSELERFEPSPGFADAVMAGLAPATARQTARAGLVSSGRATVTRALATAKRFVPRTRRAWAVISGAAVTPAATFGLVLWAVFSHPTLTPQALASFASWQLTEVLVTAWGGVVAGGLEVARMVGLDGIVEGMVQAPLVAAGGVTVYAVGLVVALRVLYKNLFDGRSPRHRYASASAS